MERARGHENYATAKVGQKGGLIFAGSRGCRRGRRGHGLEEWCDLLCKKVEVGVERTRTRQLRDRESWSRRGLDFC